MVLSKPLPQSGPQKMKKLNHVIAQTPPLSRSWWDIWLRNGVPAQRPPTLPAQCANPQNTWPGLATVGPRSPARAQPHPTQVGAFAVRCLGIDRGNPGTGQATRTRACAHTPPHPHTSPFKQTEKAVTCQQVQRTCQESPGAAFQENTWSRLTQAENEIFV